MVDTILQIINSILMKKKSPILILLLLSIQFNTQSQSKNIDSHYTNYFQNTREIPFLHLNKTSFMEGEEIWFKAYIIEQNSNKLHPTTSNLYVSIFDDEGKLKQQKLVHVKNGMGNGNFEIDSTFNKRTYYLKASTNWMKNFKEDNSYTQKIKIVSSNERENTVQSSQEDYFDFQLFPEGGHLLAQSENNIGILIKDNNNKGIKIKKGEIKNEKGKVIGQFSNNNFGLSVKNIFVPKNEILTFEATLQNGKVLKRNTKLLKNKGITINVKRYKEHFTINIKTNKTSLASLHSKKYRILVHNTKSYKNLYFTFNKKNNNYFLGLNKKDLSKGIHIITVFNEENAPVLERLIYNEFENDLSDSLNTNVLKITRDSLSLRISNNSNSKINVSASFLPLKTKAYKPKHTIKSTVLLKPYIKGTIENVTYYFSDNVNRLKNLDALLLTQGWSKYNWNSIFKSPPKTNFNFENGIDITAKFNQPIKPKQNVLIFSADNNIIKEVNPSNNNITLKNTFIKKNSNIEFTLKGKTKLYTITPVLSFSKSSLNEIFNINDTDKTKKIELETSNFKNYYNSVEVLNEVVVKAKTNYDNKVKGLGSSYRFREGKDLRLIGATLSDYILAFAKEKSYSTNPLVGVFLNDKAITRLNLSFYDIDLAEVRGVAYGTVPSGKGTLLYIYSYSKAELRELRINTRLSEIKIKVGFATDKEYYAPKYPSFTDESYINYGAIFWKPSITIEPNSNIEFSLPKDNQQEIRLFLEGISTSGKLISTEKVLNIIPKS